MKPKFHFISGLPRSGSTLLAAILRQNPKFHAGMSSPVAGMFNNMIGSFSAGSEFAPLIDTHQRRHLLRGLFDNYYHDLADKHVIFDTNRAWCAKLSALAQLFPDAKIIACVRNMAWIMDSLERQYQKDPFENTRLFTNEGERSTVSARVETLAQPTRLVGYAWAALYEGFYSEHAGSLLVIDYELLTRSPAKTISLVYQFIGEEPYSHDFDHVEYAAPEFDALLGVHELHTVRAKVECKKRKTILPPDVFRKYSAMSFWENQAGSLANVITIKQRSDNNKDEMSAHEEQEA